MQILSIDAVMSAMADYAKAAAEEKDARAKHDGYSWDWYGRNYIDAVNENRERAAKLLDDYIKACVIATLKESNVQISE